MIVNAGRRDALRRIIVTAIGVMGASNFPRSTRASVENRPDVETLQTGDLIWPKVPGQVVLYSSGAPDSRSQLIRRWEKEKAEFANRLRSSSKSTAEDLRLADTFDAMTYKQFEARYLGDFRPGHVEQTGSDVLYVGHVAVVAEASRNPLIVEAIEGEINRVRTIKYSAWLDSRPGCSVWVGRIKNLDTTEKNKFVDEARKHVGVRYDFWNLDLNNDEGFYCSKLVWQSIWRTKNLAIDDDKASKRSFWFSPKQLMHTNHVDLIFQPNVY